MRCPACGSKEIGKVGDNEFYCWDCCVEFVLSPGGVKLFNIAPDGTLVNVAETAAAMALDSNDFQ